MEKGFQPLILGSSSAFPTNSYTQDEVLHAVAKHNGLTQDEQRWAGRVFEATTIKQGSIALPPEDLGKKMDRKTYRSYIHDNLLSLSLEACRKSLADWGGSIDEITHLVWATMSAVIDAPSMDCYLVNELGLSGSTKRLAVQQMGCMGGFRCLNLAAELTATNPSARILICVVDVRSGLQNQLPPVKDGESHTKAALLSCALFRDAASSAVVGTRARPNERPKAEWLRGASHVIKGTLDQVSITDNDSSSIKWFNDRKMPATIGSQCPKVINDLIGGYGITATDPQYVVHTGGPAILKGPQHILGLPDEQLQASWDFMHDHGNTSGSSNLAILHHELTRSQDMPREYIMCLAGGPGICIEGAFLRRLDRDAPAGATAPSWRQEKLIGASWLKRTMYTVLPIGPKSMLGFYALRSYAWWMGMKDNMASHTKYVSYILGLASLA